MPPKRNPIQTDRGADNPDLTDNWRDGKHLPHWDGIHIPQSITFRLHDSVPDHVIETWKRALQNETEEERKKKLHWKIQKYMDQGHGACWLEQPEIANIVQDALLYFDEERYVVHAWVVMPNHVHVLCTVIADFELSELLHSWRSYTAQEANDILDRSGTFWGDDYHDRYIRNREHFGNAVHYIEHNPVKAGLCQNPADWNWSSAYFKEQGEF